MFQLNGGVRFRIIPTLAIEGRAINILGDQQSATAMPKDPKMYLVGISWINPF
jgi:hypothetical protein